LWAGSGSNFFGSLISDLGWVGLLSDQPVAGRARPGHVTRFDSSTFNDEILEEL